MDESVRGLELVSFLVGSPLTTCCQHSLVDYITLAALVCTTFCMLFGWFGTRSELLVG